ncbi:MAG: DUF1127 domain-containing protein [Sedimenticola selenatireducens]|uniref:DUF1127 domain-containing protein n=2 Tax=Sedimenticola selenatireducens TaxID=191960 RepID=A0A557S859_9GAMM|nr:DUF1127 domain-containing protein [Sedimenticola selenatireducens]TVT63550.1 MAG: DUF1127 domain-containing protein [Sedimenticola selenatireducens]
MQTTCLNIPDSHAHSFELKQFVSKAFQWLYAAYERKRQRNALLKLDDRMLSDIGVNRAEADNEGSKPFWKE